MIWLIGYKGMLGTELALLLERNGMEYVGTDREVDVTDEAAIADFLDSLADPVKTFTHIVNCSAYTAVDKAEDDVYVCRKINTAGPGNIAKAAERLGARLIHISTDYVFNGKGSRPYTEEDPTDPIGVYGRTKRDGELEAFKAHKDTIILRTAWLYGKHGPNFVYTMLRLMAEKESVSVVNDQIGSPTWTGDLAGTIVKILKAPVFPPGTYHYSDEGRISWYDFAKEIYRQGTEKGILAHDCTMKPCTSAEYPAKVTRPAYSVLDKTKIKSTLGIRVPEWGESLSQFLNEVDR